MASAEQHGYGPDLAWFSYLVGPVFFALAAWCLWGPDVAEIPRRAPSHVEPSRLSFAPPRKSLGETPAVEVEGVRRACTDCHHLFPPSEETPTELVFHRHIRLEHGMNDRCRNCHAIGERNLLVLHGGQLVSFAQSPLLCAKCHGPTYRDWEYGAHGRTNGYWDASRGEVRRLQCVECHNPHDPAVEDMDPIAPLPAPHIPLRHGSREAHQ